MLNKVKKYLYLIFIKYFGVIIIPCLALDLITKKVMEDILLKAANNTIEWLPFFNFTLVYNTGSFSGWLGGDIGHIVLILISFLGAIGIPYCFIKYRNKMNLGMAIGVALIIPGDIGNLVDRLYYVGGKPRGVIDFFHFYINSIGFDWPVFNVADACLVVGVIVFAIFYIMLDIQESKQKKLAQEKIIEEAKLKKQAEEKIAQSEDSSQKGEDDGK